MFFKDVKKVSVHPLSHGINLVPTKTCKMKPQSSCRTTWEQQIVLSFTWQRSILYSTPDHYSDCTCCDCDIVSIVFFKFMFTLCTISILLWFFLCVYSVSKDLKKLCMRGSFRGPEVCVYQSGASFAHRQNAAVGDSHWIFYHYHCVKPHGQHQRFCSCKRSQLHHCRVHQQQCRWGSKREPHDKNKWVKTRR